MPREIAEILLGAGCASRQQRGECRMHRFCASIARSNGPRGANPGREKFIPSFHKHHIANHLLPHARLDRTGRGCKKPVPSGTMGRNPRQGAWQAGSGVYKTLVCGPLLPSCSPPARQSAAHRSVPRSLEGACACVCRVEVTDNVAHVPVALIRIGIDHCKAMFVRKALKSVFESARRFRPRRRGRRRD
jgi:hypothetical protein